MKKLIFTVAICAFVLTSCGDKTKTAASADEKACCTEAVTDSTEIDSTEIEVVMDSTEIVAETAGDSILAETAVKAESTEESAETDSEE
jgi:hypothetical protein